MSYNDVFAQERFNKVYSSISTHRIDTFIRSVEQRKGKNKGNILAFVRGLRLSALIIYQIRDILSATEFYAYWGQLISDDGQFLSNECDIIICKRDVHQHKWNGDGESNIMDYRFINCKDAIAVISCKSFLTKSDVEYEYSENLKKYIKKIWLFAECCGPRSIDKIREESKKRGYKKFWFLYTWSRTKGNHTVNIKDWMKFEKALIKLTL